MQRYGFFSAHSELSRRFAKIIEKNVLSSEMTKINLSVTKINLSVTKIEISVTKIEISVTKIRPCFCEGKAVM